MSEERLIRKAEFNPKVCVYWLWPVAFILVIIVVGIPLLPFWFLLGFALTKRYLDAMECVLTDKSLKVKKGIFTKIEKTIPLEKITDMGMIQGPLMRHFGLHQLTVETAGQSEYGALVSLIGIVDAKAFREAVLRQREAVSATTPHTPAETVAQDAPDTNALLSEIRDSLRRIEGTLEKRSNN